MTISSVESINSIGSYIDNFIYRPDDYKRIDISEEEKKVLVEKLRNTKQKNLGYPLGLLFSFYCSLVQFLTPYIICRYGVLAFLCFIPFRVAIDYIDRKTSNSHEINMINIKLNGYNTKRVETTWFINSFAVLTVYYIAFNLILPEIKEFTLDLVMIIKIIGLAVVTEIYFYQSHKFMHKYSPDSHRLHHCCLHSTITTNLVFDPLDVFLEFYMPNIIALIITTLLQDGELFLAFAMFQITAYTSNHDEYYKTHHYSHHTLSDSAYGVYTNIRVYNPNDEVKKSLETR